MSATKTFSAKTPNAITWLHLSDIHVQKNKSTTNRLSLQEMPEDLKVCQRDYGLRTDMVMFTGDAAFAGKPDEFDDVKTWLGIVLKVTNVRP